MKIQIVLFLFSYLGIVSADTVTQQITGDKVLRISPSNELQVKFLKDWIARNDVDIWKEVNEPAKIVDALIKKNDLLSVESTLKVHGIAYKVLVNDVEKLMDEEKQSNQKFTFSTGFQYTKYGTWDEIHGELNSLAKIHSKKVSLFNVGKTYEGRDQIGIKITNGDGKDKPVIWIDGGIHSREWISPATVMYFINQLLTSNDTKIHQILSKYDFHVLPVFNIDGYVYTHRGKDERLWRKTRSKSGFSCFGTDPNRNWAINFAGIGTSDYPCSNIYPGKYAFSEKEVRNVANYLGNLHNLKSYWTVHAYGNLFLIPWAYTTELPKDYDEMMRIGNIFAENVIKKHGTKYSVGSPAKILYACSGISADWVYDTLGVKYSFTLELRDDGTHGFILPADQILPVGEEVTQALVESILAMK